MYLDLPPKSAIFGDNAFENHYLEDNSGQIGELEWEIMRKKNTTRGDIYQIQLWENRSAGKLNLISAALPKSIHAVTVDGFNLNTFMFIFAYALTFLFPDINPV